MAQSFEDKYNEQVLKNQQSSISNQNQNTYANSVYTNQGQKNNLVEFELSFKDELDDIERLLRGEVLINDESGQRWVKPFKEVLFLCYKDENNILYYILDNKLFQVEFNNNSYDFSNDNLTFETNNNFLQCERDNISSLILTNKKPTLLGYKKAKITDNTKTFLNDLGVNDMLRNIITLVNKNKVLSNYNPEEINKRVRQLKHEIRTLIYNNYEDYGIDNEYKMNNYSMTVLSVGSIVEDVYRRAMNGETHRGLSEQRLVTQSEPLNNYQPMAQPQGKKHWWNFKR